MGVNVVTYGGRTLVDMTDATITPETVLEGYVGYGADGEPIVGTAVIHPVGSIYMSADETSPASLFGGTWTQLKDRFLLAAGDEYTNGDTGGAATVTLTTSEIPSHVHKLVIASSYNSGTISTDQLEPGHGINSSVSSDKVYTTANPVNSTGGGGSHENMPPYVVVYAWKRVE